MGSGTWPCNFPRRPFKKKQKKQMKTTFSPESKKTTPIEIDSAVFFLTIEFRTLPLANSSLDLPCRGSVTSGTWPCNFPRRPFIKKQKKKQMKTTFSPKSKKTTPIEIDSAVFF